VALAAKPSRINALLQKFQIYLVSFLHLTERKDCDILLLINRRVYMIEDTQCGHIWRRSP